MLIISAKFYESYKTTKLHANIGVSLLSNISGIILQPKESNLALKGFLLSRTGLFQKINVHFKFSGLPDLLPSLYSLDCKDC
jgi:hypothetical protein